MGLWAHIPERNLPVWIFQAISYLEGFEQDLPAGFIEEWAELMIKLVPFVPLVGYDVLAFGVNVVVRISMWVADNQFDRELLPRGEGRGCLLVLRMER